MIFVKNYLSTIFLKIPVTFSEITDFLTYINKKELYNSSKKITTRMDNI